MDKNVEISILYELYQGLLTEKQALLVEYYYYDDLSLGEIAENLGITRQGVRDALVRAEDILKDAELKIGMQRKNEATEKLLCDILALCREGLLKTENDNDKAIYEKIIGLILKDQDGEDAYGI